MMLDTNIFLNNKVLLKSITSNKISNAYIFYGIDLDSLNKVAIDFIKSILCKNDLFYCDECATCKRINEKNYPDIIKIIKDGQGIRIGQIKQIINDCSYPPSEGERKFYIIKEANLLNEQAQNAFLKTLEESNDKITYILLSEGLNNLLPTIISRLTPISFYDIKEDLLSSEEEVFVLENIQSILINNDSNILFIKNIAKDKDLFIKYCRYILKLFCDTLIYNKSGKININKDFYAKAIKEISFNISNKKLNNLIDNLSEFISTLGYNVNINLASLTLLMYLQEEI